MKYFSLIAITCILALIYTNCSKVGFDADGIGMSNVNSLSISGENVTPIDIGGCGGYVNEPCVSVTICTPGTTSCQTIDRVLLDTGSHGLRLFSSVVKLTLPSQTNSSGVPYAECMSYMDGSAQWGPVKVADIQIGGLKAGNVPMQVIDANYGTVPASCGTPENDPDEVGFNGILGVGLFAEDCGSSCTTSTSTNLYYVCSGSTCSGATITKAKQVTNPVAMMPTDNNGVVLKLPAIPSAGAIQVTGYLIMGIGTRANNTFTNLTKFQTDSSGNFKTTFNGQTYPDSFIDSGSNGLYFPGSGVLTACSTGLSDFFCPTSPQAFTAINAGSTGSPTSTVSFEIQSAATIMSNSNPNWVFNNLGGQNADGFDWGLPFFFGRTIGFGIENKTSPLGTGPFYAY